MLDLRNIHKSFFIGTPNEFEVLHGLNFTVKEGEFVSIVGQSILMEWILRRQRITSFQLSEIKK